MAQLVVRNLEESVKARLQKRARRNRRSMEEEVREILRNAVTQPEPSVGLGTAIANIFAKTGYDFEVPELRGFNIERVVFDEPDSEKE
jgi:antitoxin FitA